jgi:hypothetical protein
VPDQAPVASRWMLSKVTDLDAQVAAVNCTYAAASWSGGKTFSQCAVTGSHVAEA